MPASFDIFSKFNAVDKFSGTIGKMSRATDKFGSRAKANFARADRQARKFRATVSTVNSKLFNMRNAAGFLVAGTIVRGVQRITNETANYTDNLAKNARFLDMEISQLQGYRFAAERAGVATTKMDKAFESVGKRVGELREDTGSLYTFLEKRGDTALINQLKAAENTDQAMKLLADKYQSLDSQTEKAGFASKAFSKTNMEVAKVMEHGSGNLQKQIDRFKKYGPDVDESAEAAENFKDTQLDMQLATKSVTTIIGTELIPKVNTAMRKTSEWIAENKALIKSKAEEWVGRFTEFMKGALVVGKSMFSTVKTGVMIMWNFISTILTILSPIGRLIGLFSDADKKSESWEGKLQLLGTVLGIVTTGILAMNVASKAAMFFQGAMKAATVGVTAAQWSYNFVLGVTTAMMGKQAIALRTSKAALVGYQVVTKVATAAQWAWNAALNANPIGLIIAGVAGLIGLITLVTKKWDSWGASVAFFMGPLGMVISLIQSFRKHWDTIVEAFKTEGIIAGLKAIGMAILDAVLMPVQQLLEQVGKLPTWLGGGIAQSGAEAIENLRKDIGALGDEVEDTADKAKKMPDHIIPTTEQMLGMEQGSGEQQAQKLNPRRAEMEAVSRRIEENRQTVDLNINDPDNRTEVSKRQETKKNKGGVRLTKNLGSFAK